MIKPKQQQTKQESGLESGMTELSTLETPPLENQSNNGSLLIENILWRTFIEVSVTENYSLVGGPEKWEEILCEYADNVRSPKSENIFDCWRKIRFIEFKIEFVQTALSVLNDFYSERVALCLVELGFDYIENNQDTTVYRRSLQRLETEAKVLLVLYNQYQAEYASLNKSSGDSKRNRMDFEKEMAILRKDGYKIKKSTTVLEMCAIINTFIESHARTTV